LKILVTGGAGYIGSHFVKLLKANGHEPVVVDNLSRGHKEAVIKDVILEETDILDFPDLADVFKNHMPDAVVHFAAFAYVGESVEHPEMYYKNNVIGSMNLINACVEFGVNKFVFSSTCSIYGNPLKVPISESESSKPINPYANTKLMIEMMLKDYEIAHGLKHVALRYFNAAGADPSGELGESHEPETHLIPLVLQTAQKKRDKILVFGNDYNTPDGTCIRDYIHILDLADAHLKALNYLNDGKDSTFINLGTGSGNSVLEIIQKAKSITGNEIPFEIVDRRAGDPAILVADNKKAKELLDWSPKYSIDEILKTAWNWHTNPKY
jgi:UDP-glucose 4-epimerase